LLPFDTRNTLLAETIKVGSGMEHKVETAPDKKTKKKGVLNKRYFSEKNTIE
jgi:hypothetical protein